MSTFSERNGYIKPSKVYIREEITPEIQNAICSCFDELDELFQEANMYTHYKEMEKFLWTHFLNQRAAKFYTNNSYHIVATRIIEDVKEKWYRKLDLLELAIKYLRNINNDYYKLRFTDTFINMLNVEFERLNFAYRIINDIITPITDEEEIKAIENAMQDSTDNIKMHLSKALELYAKRPNADYRNSIKESISAVEAYCREKTGTSTLGDALKSLESNGIVIPQMLKVAFDKLYAYTNQPDTGIRHSLMDDEGKYTPKEDEAAFMLVACSAFINYLKKKASMI